MCRRVQGNHRQSHCSLNRRFLHEPPRAHAARARLQPRAAAGVPRAAGRRGGARTRIALRDRGGAAGCGRGGGRARGPAGPGHGAARRRAGVREGVHERGRRCPASRAACTRGRAGAGAGDGPSLATPQEAALSTLLSPNQRTAAEGAARRCVSACVSCAAFERGRPAKQARPECASLADAPRLTRSPHLAVGGRRGGRPGPIFDVQAAAGRIPPFAGMGRGAAARGRTATRGRAVLLRDAELVSAWGQGSRTALPAAAVRRCGAPGAGGLHFCPRGGPVRSAGRPRAALSAGLVKQAPIPTARCHTTRSQRTRIGGQCQRAARTSGSQGRLSDEGRTPARAPGGAAWSSPSMTLPMPLSSCGRPPSIALVTGPVAAWRPARGAQLTCGQH